MREIAVRLCYIFLGAASAQAQQATHVILVKDRDDYRSVQLHIPAGHDGVMPLPLVFNLHGSNGSAERQELLSGMFAVADANQFLVALGMATYESPPATGNARKQKTPHGAGFSVESGIGSVFFPAPCQPHSHETDTK